MYPAVRIVALCVQQSAKGVLHGACGGRVDMAFDCWQVDDALALEILGHEDALRENAVQHVHAGLGLVDLPLDVRILKVVQDGDVVAPEDRHIVVEVFALESIGHHRLVLDAYLSGIAASLQGEDCALQLPGGGIRTGKRQVPGDIVLEDDGVAGGEIAFHLCQFDQAIIVIQDGFRLRLEHRHPRTCGHSVCPCLVLVPGPVERF